MRSLRKGAQNPALRLLIWFLALTFTAHPIVATAQRRNKESTRRPTRSGIDTFSSRTGGQATEGELPLEIGTISKAAFDAVIRTGRYVLGPGDAFSVVVDTDEELIAKEVFVGAEGTLVIPYVGAVMVAGKPLVQAQADIDTAISGRFKHLDISVNLARLRHFPVNVIGEVKFPGAYLVNGVEQVSELIFKAGGLLDETKGRASLRNIEIRTASITSEPGNARKADMILWNLTGDIRHNPFVVDGDLIFVPVKGDSVTISGAIHRPGSYEHAGGDRVADLVRLGRGLLGDPSGSTAEVLSLKTDGLVRIQVDLEKALNEDPTSNVELFAGDKLFVHGDEPRVTLEGEVRFPGAYPVTRDLTLKGLIDIAGGFTELAGLRQSSVIRRVEYGVGAEEDVKLARLLNLPRNQLTDGDRAYITMKTQQIPGRLPVDFVGLFNRNDLSQDIQLKGDDLIRVPRLRPTVLVNGSVVSPAAIPFDPSFTVQDYIHRAGGFTDNARKRDVYVIVGSTGNSAKANEVNTIAPGDAIFVPAETAGQAWRTFRELVTVASQIATLVLTIVAINR
ncbi:SLBB domain-containing protein [bacterium]|nr:SLBB domain-containing protein [bacterium]